MTGVSTIAGLIFWRWVAQRICEAHTARLSVVFVGGLPLLMRLVPNLGLILAAVAVNGFFTGSITVSRLNALLNMLPEDRQPHCMGLWSAVQNAGALLAARVAVQPEVKGAQRHGQCSGMCCHPE